MSDRRFPTKRTLFLNRLSLRTNDGSSQRPKRRWLAILWIFATVVATVGWWSGLAWGATWLVERAFS